MPRLSRLPTTAQHPSKHPDAISTSWSCPRPLGSASAPLLLLSGFLPQLVLQPDTSQSTLHSGFPTPSAMDPEVPFLSSLSSAPHCPHQPCPTPGRHRGLLTLDSTAIPLPRAPGLPPVHGQHVCSARSQARHDPVVSAFPGSWRTAGARPVLRLIITTARALRSCKTQEEGRCCVTTVGQQGKGSPIKGPSGLGLVSPGPGTLDHPLGATGIVPGASLLFLPGAFSQNHHAEENGNAQHSSVPWQKDTWALASSMAASGWPDWLRGQPTKCPTPLRQQQATLDTTHSCGLDEELQSSGWCGLHLSSRTTWPMVVKQSPDSPSSHMARMHTDTHARTHPTPHMPLSKGHFPTQPGGQEAWRWVMGKQVDKPTSSRSRDLLGLCLSSLPGKARTPTPQMAPRRNHSQSPQNALRQLRALTHFQGPRQKDASTWQGSPQSTALGKGAASLQLY